jgi:O-antigen ligase
MEALTQQFYRWGWLAPALLPLTQLGGRALFTLVIWLYFLWGTAVFISKQVTLDKKYLLLFIILLISYALGIPFAEDPIRAFRKWINFVAMVAVFPISWMMLEDQGQEAAQRLIKWVAMLGLVMVVVAYGQLLYQTQQPGFSPILQMREDSMPYLLPFILLFLYKITNIKARWMGMIVVTAGVLFYVFLSEGRAAQLSAVLALFIFFIATLDVRWYIACIVSILFLLAMAVGNLDTFIQLSGSEQGIYDVMNRFTSYRWELWDHAIEHAPDWNLFGYGMGNIRFVDEIVTFSSGGSVAHLHNFVLDLWFETGWVGLIAYLTFLISIIYAALSRYASMSPELKGVVGAVLASAGAILVAGLFSFSYSSKQFGVYLMLCLALLAWCAGAKSQKHAE